MRPLIRFTIGDATPSGFLCLRTSICRLRRLYPECDLVVCHNQIKSSIFENDIATIDQSQYRCSLPIEPDNDVCWKLYPPRLRLNAHEIFIDNDIVLENRLPEIDHFLTSDNSILAYQGLHRNFGFFDSFVPMPKQLNSGIFGLPPHYNFQYKLSQMMKSTGFRQWTTKFDEQGLVASLLLNEPDCRMISLTSVPIIEPDWHIYQYLYNKNTLGYHFVGLNKSHLHLGWEDYNTGKLL